MNKKGKIAITQIALLIVSIIAIAWMMGSSIPEVSASGESLPTVGQACGTDSAGLCKYYSTIKNAGDTCDAGSGEGIIEVGKCSGDEHVRCCVPTTTTSSSSGSSGGSNAGIDTAINSLLGGKAWYDEIKNIVKKKTTTPTTVDKAVVDEVKQTTSSNEVPLLHYNDGYSLKEFLFGGVKDSSGTWTGVGGSSTIGAIGAITVWTGIAFLTGRYVIGPLLGLNTYNSQVLGYSLAAGTAAALFSTSATILGASAVGGPVGIAIGVVVAAVVFVVFARTSANDVITYNCYEWDAKTGGADCEECNNQDIPCTEYQCHSLGQACEFSVDSISGQSLCVWNNSHDLKAPTITPRIESLIDNETYRYTPDNSISPPDSGVALQYTLDPEGCTPAWTEVSFGVSLDERARCKYSPGVIFDSYDEMPDLYLSDGKRLYNHTYTLSLPSTDALEIENTTLENGGVYDFYIRCEDGNGNSNAGSYDIHFCIQDSADTIAPIIKKVSPVNETPVATGTTSTNITVYVNEPSECRWSYQDKSFEAMEGNMTCSTSVTNANAQLLFPCYATLDGLKDNQKNNYYFRCKDQPQYASVNESLRNENQQSYHYTLVGTEALVISSVTPNKTIIKDSTTPVKVTIQAKTALGYDDGKAICSISSTGETGSYSEFFYGYNTDRYSQYKHNQTLYLSEGNYSYYIQCCDLGQNCDVEKINFGIDTDTTSPEIIRLYKEGNYLKLMTDEESTCVYSTTSCTYSFDDGLEMNTISGGTDTQHYTDWSLNTNYYIKCEDTFGNRPASSQCTVIARPFEIPELK